MTSNTDMSAFLDKWVDFFEPIQQGLGGYDPEPMIAEMIRLFLSNIDEGIVLVDKDGRIRYMDRPSEELLNFSPGESKGKLFTELYPDHGILEVLKSGLPQFGLIQDVCGIKKIVTRFPLVKNGEIIGAIGKVVFQNFDVVRQLSERIRELEDRVSQYRQRFLAANEAKYTFDNIVCLSQVMVDTKKIAERIASVDCTVLLVGESGTGKELFAHSIHQASDRRKGPFVRVNCASIPYELAESELFGYEKGAFSGASHTGYKGKFEIASGGTIFLDEISSMPLAIQGKLLRVIQDKEIQPLGSTQPRKVDFRLLAATNINLETLVQRGSFRADLFYRLSSMPIHIPPLRERLEDIPIILKSLLPLINQRLKGTARTIEPAALDLLGSYGWPGNVRQFANVIEQAVLKACPADQISRKDLPEFLNLKCSERPSGPEHMNSTVRKAERKAIMDALEVTKGNKKQAAKALGISRAALYQKMGRLGIKSN